MRRWCTLLACDGLPQARAPRTTLSTVPLQERDRSLDARVTVLLGVDGCIASGARKVALLDLVDEALVLLWIHPVRKGSQHLGVLMGKEELGQHSPAAALEELGEA